MRKRKLVSVLCAGLCASSMFVSAFHPLLSVSVWAETEEVRTDETLNGIVQFETGWDEEGRQIAWLEKVMMDDTDCLEYEVPAVLEGGIAVVGIRKHAFEKIPVETITIPQGVDVEAGSFHECYSLKEIRFEDPEAANADMLADCPDVRITDWNGNDLSDLLRIEDPEDQYEQDQNQENHEKSISQDTDENVTEADEAAVIIVEEETVVLTAGDQNVSGKGSWVKSGSNWKYKENGSYLKSVWRKIDGSTYYFKSDGTMARGWLVIDGDWYHFVSDGRLSRNVWIGNDYVGADGKWIQPYWGVRNGKTCFIKGDGTLTTNSWKKKDGHWYWLGSDGYFYTKGFKTISGEEYYFGSDGIMAENKWITENGKTRYMSGSGAALRDKRITLDGKDLYFNGSGDLGQGVFLYGGESHFADKGIVVKDVFAKSSGSVYYCDVNGIIPKHTFRVNNIRFKPNTLGVISSVTVNNKSSYPKDHFSWNDAFGNAAVISVSEMTNFLTGKLGTPKVGESLTKTIDGVSYQMLRFPHKYMKITQGANGSFTHQGVEALDLAGVDSGTDQVYAPCDMHLAGTMSYAYGNAMFFESDKPVLFADGTIDYASFLVLHDSYITDVKKNLKQGEEFADEGVAGYATGNHTHFEVAKGKVSTTYYRNMYGVYGLRNSVPVDQACVIDGVTLDNKGQPLGGDGLKMEWRKSSDVKKSTGIKDKPKDAVDQLGKFWVTTDAIKVRMAPGTDAKEAGYSLSYGKHVVYDCYVRKGGYTWLGFIDKIGNRRWMASGKHNGEAYTERYGVFE